MKSKHEIPSKLEHMKAHSFHFLINEIVHSELIHQNNVGNIKEEFYTDAQRNTEKPKIEEEIAEKMEHVNYERLYKGIEKGPKSGVIIETKTDYTGSAPKRYTTKCYVEPRAVPIWYTESVLLHIGSTRRKYEEKIYFKNKLVPFKWSELMVTEAKSNIKVIVSESQVPVKSDNFTSSTPQVAATAS